MQTSLVLFIVAKHLTNAAKEIEALETEALRQKIDNAVIIPEAPETKKQLSNNADTNQGKVDESTKESSSQGQESSQQESSCKEASGEKSPREEVKAPKKAKKSSEKKEEAPKEVVNVPERKLTLEIVRAECAKVINEKGRAALAGLLSQFGAAKTSELKEDQFNAVFDACQKTLGVGNEF